MSWTSGLPATDIADAITALDQHTIKGEGDAAAEVEQQFTAAKEAAKGLIELGALGTDGTVIISLNGHATYGHEGEESIGIHISRKPAPVEAEEFDEEEDGEPVAE